MRLKNGKFGEFWACSNYPTCNHTIQKPKTTGVACPQCQKGHFIEKMSKNGKQFWACDYYPNCKNIVWNEPVAQKCEHCLHPLLQKVNGKLRCVSCNKENTPIK